MSRKREIRLFVVKKIGEIQRMTGSGGDAAVLAELRKGLGKKPGALPGLMGFILKDMPVDFMSRTGEATREEWVCYMALTLFAWHQQGHNLGKECVHTDEDISMGSALRKAAKAAGDENADERMLRRLKSILTSSNMEGIYYHLRNTIKVLNGSGIVLNYAKLAGDLYEWSFPESRNKVGLRWGQDYYRAYEKEEDGDEE